MERASARVGVLGCPRDRGLTDGVWSCLGVAVRALAARHLDSHRRRRERRAPRDRAVQAALGGMALQEDHETSSQGAGSRCVHSRGYLVPHVLCRTLHPAALICGSRGSADARAHGARRWRSGAMDRPPGRLCQRLGGMGRHLHLCSRPQRALRGLELGARDAERAGYRRAGLYGPLGQRDPSLGAQPIRRGRWYRGEPHCRPDGAGRFLLYSFSCARQRRVAPATGAGVGRLPSDPAE